MFFSTPEREPNTTALMTRGRRRTNASPDKALGPRRHASGALSAKAAAALYAPCAADVAPMSVLGVPERGPSSALSATDGGAFRRQNTGATLQATNGPGDRPRQLRTNRQW